MLSAAILAGGRASRFGGVDKGALVIGGRSIRERQLQELTTLTDDIMLVGGSGPTPLWPARHVADRVADSGPLGGLDAALWSARHDVVAIVACDMPFVTARFLAYLRQFADQSDAIVPRTDRGYHPLCAVYTRACQDAVARRLAEGRLAMVGLLNEVACHVVTASDIAAFGDPARLLANVNTPAEYEALEAQPGHKR
jgi:molybdopterin-guanine dinucleotide biosynthesis protein A